VVSHLDCDPNFVPELLQLKPRPKDGEGAGPKHTAGVRDPLYDQAVDVIVREGRGSVSLLQRALGIGYGKAARFIDFMAEDGIVGHYNGSQAREVIVTMEQWEEMKAARQEV
jgi:S-DNA-T family DNA segregation ATPase FtsK/SpoIIIE